MAKFVSPTGSNVIWLSQTTHGENANKPNDLSLQQAIDISMNGNASWYSVCNGRVELTATELGGYVSIIPTGANWRTLNVHLKDFAVKAGQQVKAGDYLGKIVPVAPTHCHLGCKNISGVGPHPNPMDYFDHGIIFKTTHQAIADIWFNNKDMNGGLNWSLFRDLNYDSGTNMDFKKGDVIIFTERQNKRGGAGTGFGDMGAYEPGELATIKDGPRASQNAQFYGKGSNMKTNDNYTWFDTVSSSGQSFWVAEMGKFRLATPGEINPPKPPQEPVIPPALTECQNRVKSLEKEIGALESKLEACRVEKDAKVAELADCKKLTKRLEAEVAQLVMEKVDLLEELERISEERDRFEKEKLDLQEQLSKGSLADASAGDMFAELWKRFIKSLDSKA